jgi:hypothetical protein
MNCVKIVSLIWSMILADYNLLFLLYVTRFLLRSKETANIAMPKLGFDKQRHNTGSSRANSLLYSDLIKYSVWNTQNCFYFVVKISIIQ